jgi:death-on-curing protein
MNEPIWLQEKVVLAIHQRQLAEHGGMAGVHDSGLLASALARPRHLLAYGKLDLAALAASYAYGIVKNHPFVDGNKRTGYVVCRTFLKLNGCEIEASEIEKFQSFVGLADGSLSEEQFADWIRTHSV